MRAFLDRFVPKGSIVLAITTLLSYVLGLVRDRTFAHTFGASSSLDSYNAAFLVPDFLFNLLVAGGISAAVVPIFIELKRRKQSEALAYINTVFFLSSGLMLLVGLVMLIGAPLLSRLVAPGLDESSRILVVQLMHILAFSPVLFSLSNTLGAMLTAERHFWSYGLSPVVYNVGIIAGALFLAPTMGIIGVAYGTLFGALLHFLMRLFDSMWHVGWRWSIPVRLWTPEIRRTVLLMLPKMVGHPVELVTFWVFTSLASLLAPGSITVLSFARNFQSVPVSLIGIAVATAAFPALAEAALASNKQLRSLVYSTSGAILLASSLAAFLLYGIRYPIIRLLLGGGAFDAEAIARTALVLGFFCFSIPTEAVSHVLARSFYATQNTSIPVIFSFVSLVVSGAVAYGALSSIGIISLPIGFFCGSLAKTVGLYILFLRRTRA